ncbi:Integral membrane protein OS=Tsukamurella paurometabola (strain ATCC 8368 / DSM / CCUG 35730/ CIP 100753 / JCM 10117 / KCTC 9821 / NBRC 16120 / NCIMB 702349/ NCTC 13040) OX=521096 GN=Tpau_0530 PE=4 SV=1 [Tsukamurella paurometabola]|uniref:Uncharacterized protein n=1 Tax=Tsukamurella paurometabola (strain ATCC 8368 / DSM 20162 / CCUG 35730 / CIP 100753 / JCM 10117 / KCTC 9821 / NBRC 16120 / NCIMB 702349 / NCTC 13040) TaxID=521096 RepID=D5USA4_TSUPD|nr:hypothetical protein [Tsukamurella paurometabola]ADG77171.1 hypothetical protein Tpau_0530 [Tsukamurella paurometabola DSM 20162]SUP43044.1 Uncharacterised protein [Tsukamurella paurometabola]
MTNPDDPTRRYQQQSYPTQQQPGYQQAPTPDGPPPEVWARYAGGMFVLGLLAVGVLWVMNLLANVVGNAVSSNWWTHNLTSSAYWFAIGLTIVAGVIYALLFVVVPRNTVGRYWSAFGAIAVIGAFLSPLVPGIDSTNWGEALYLITLRVPVVILIVSLTGVNGSSLTARQR